jgi:hypothetical protein
LSFAASQGFDGLFFADRVRPLMLALAGGLFSLTSVIVALFIFTLSTTEVEAWPWASSRACCWRAYESRFFSRRPRSMLSAFCRPFGSPSCFWNKIRFIPFPPFFVRLYGFGRSTKMGAKTLLTNHRRTKNILTNLDL